jgi:hypothetical protein
MYSTKIQDIVGKGSNQAGTSYMKYLEMKIKLPLGSSISVSLSDGWSVILLPKGNLTISGDIFHFLS